MRIMFQNHVNAMAKVEDHENAGGTSIHALCVQRLYNTMLGTIYKLKRKRK
jgi:hypothetical protein